MAPLNRVATPRRLLNFAQAELHLLRGDTVLKSLPYVVSIDPTNICNLRCPLCPTGQGIRARPHGRMSLPLFRSLIEQIAADSYKVVLHNWGEPLLHPDIAEMVASATEKRLATEFSSNLNLLSDPLAESIVRAGLGRLVVSIDGGTQTTYEVYRQGGNLERVLANLARVADAKRRLGSRLPYIEVQVLVMRHNLHELPLIARKVHEAGTDHCEIGFTVVNTLRRAEAEEWLPAPGQYLRYDTRTMADRFNSPRRRCAWLWRSMVVNWDGTVYPCCNFERKEAEMGDLSRESVRSLWNSPGYQGARADFKQPVGTLPEGPLRPGEPLCSWCRGVPRAQDADQHGVY